MHENTCILLINPLDITFSIMHTSNRLPYDLLYIDSYFHSKGVNTRYLDIGNQGMTREGFKACIKEINADYYVINTNGGTFQNRSFYMTDKHVKDIILCIRDYKPDSFVMLCGQTSNLYPEMYFKLDADCVVYDEPEYSIFEIVKQEIKRSADLKGVRGIYFKDGDRIIRNDPRNAMKSLDELPPPRWENLGGYFWDSTYREKKEFIDIAGMRGCPYGCKFCKSSLSRKVLLHSPAYLLEQIKVLNRDFGYTDFFIRDAGYFDDDLRCQQLCEGLKQIKGIIWKCNARVDNMKLDKLKTMKEAGCSLISYGVESGNEEVLREINKGINRKTIIDTVAATRKAGIRVATYFIIGLPQERFLKRIKSMFFAKTLNPDILYISQYYSLDAAERFRHSWGKSIRLLLDIFLVILLFLGRKRFITYYCKVRLDRVEYDLENYRINKQKIRW
ncbi:MAG: radical SAM protein [Candidatus Omnitrophica bacterium]|nr:radical SAM protein [Candidatus Omnitrophota bacterium]